MKNIRCKSIIVSLILSTMMLSGCNSLGEPAVASTNYEAVRVDEKFMSIDALDGRIYVDKETLCQYYFIKVGYGGGAALLVNPDGSPKLYEGEIK